MLATSFVIAIAGYFAYRWMTRRARRPEGSAVHDRRDLSAVAVQNADHGQSGHRYPLWRSSA
jgi:hypothetical protein